MCKPDAYLRTPTGARCRDDDDVEDDARSTPSTATFPRSCRSENMISPDIFLPRAVTPEREPDPKLEDKLRREAFRMKRRGFVESCRTLVAPRTADVEFYERKLARRAAAYAQALAEANAQYDELSRAYETLERQNKDLVRRLETKDAEVKAVKTTMQIHFDDRLRREVSKRESQYAIQVAKLARLRETDRTAHASKVADLAASHDVQLAKQGVAYATLARKFDELKLAIAGLAKGCGQPRATRAGAQPRSIPPALCDARAVV